MKSYSVLLPLFFFTLLTRAVPNRKVVEWKIDMFRAANGDRNAECEPVGLLEPPGHYAGYYPIKDTEDGHLFYMYFENREKDPDAPLVFWTNGGPGCSSLFGLFYENGPYQIQEDQSLCWMEYGWDIGHNIVFVEQPIGVGYSYSSMGSDYATSEVPVGIDVVDFLWAFLEEHPELAEKELYVTGESFAGHYLPAIAKAILLANARGAGPYLNLQGVVMIDPWLSPSQSYRAYPEYAHEVDLIGPTTMTNLLSTWSTCDTSLATCGLPIPFIRSLLCTGALGYCQANLFNPILLINPGLNYYDIRKGCPVSGCYDVSALKKLLNKPSVKEILGAKATRQWIQCRRDVDQLLRWDQAIDNIDTVASLVDYGLKVTVWNGDQDLICNYKGTMSSLDHMKSSWSAEWSTAEKKPLDLGDYDGGFVKSAGPLSFVLVPQSGHMIPMDQPKVGWELLNAFTRGLPFPTKEPELPTT